MKKRELTEWLGLTYADMLTYLALGAAIAMFFIRHAGLDVLLAVTAITLSVISCIVGMKRDPQVSNFTNIMKRTGYPFALVIIALIIAFHYTFGVVLNSFESPKSYYVASRAMQPTLEVHDRVMTDQGAYRSRNPERGEIVVFRPGETLISRGLTGVIISRIIALPNEQVEVRDGKTFINQKPLEEKYIAEQPDYQYGPILVPQNSYFMLGDNRNNSYDSKDWGFVPASNVIGKVKLIYWPPNRYGSLSKES